MTLKLNTVTLVCLDTRNVEAAIDSMSRSLSKVKFAENILFTSKTMCTKELKVKANLAGIKLEYVPEIKSITEYSLFILSNLRIFSLFSGTHNEESIYKIIDLMKSYNINKDSSKVWFGQLYGMSDNISFNLANEGFNVIKYLPFGPIKEVIPYLIRRAEENTSVKGQTSRELELIRTELKRRKSI